MRIMSRLFLFGLVVGFIYVGCQSKKPADKFAQFNQSFFAMYIPEFPGARLLTKADIPEKQQVFFDEENGQLQLLLDMNNNTISEYIICGVSDSMLQKNEKGAYFIAMFEETKTGIVRHLIQQLWIAPVNLKPSNERSGVTISFAFKSEYAAEIYYKNNKYHLQRWF